MKNLMCALAIALFGFLVVPQTTPLSKNENVNCADGGEGSGAGVRGGYCYENLENGGIQGGGYADGGLQGGGITDVTNNGGFSLV